MLEIMLGSAWFLLGAYALWFVSRAKTFQPLTLDELALSWRLHKSETNCKASHIHDLLVKNDKIVGFKCDCGYVYLQKRPITQKAHLNTQNNKPPTISKIEESHQEHTHTTPDSSIHYLNIKKI
jgi:hypothetical protein